jgi:hypothetical protein
LAVQGSYPNLSLRSRELREQRATTIEVGAFGQQGTLAWSVTAYHGRWGGEILRLADASGLPRGAVNAGTPNHAAAVALYFMFYNFARVHQTLRVTPAMEAGVANHVWSIAEIVALLEELGFYLQAFHPANVPIGCHEYVLRNWRLVKVATTKAQRKLFFNLRRLKTRSAALSTKEAHAIAKDLGVRPEDCSVVAPAKGHIKGTIYTTELIGDHTLVTVETERDKLTVKASKDFNGRQGDAIGVLMPKDHLFVFDAETGQRIR